MPIDAFLAILGSARVERWTCASEEELQEARRGEEHVVEMLELELSRQCGRSIHLGPPLVPERGAETAHDRPEERGGSGGLEPSLRVGGEAGLAPLQGAALAVVVDEPFTVARYLDDPQSPRRRARALAFSGQLASYRHLLDHDPQSGFYLPLNFETPFELNHRGDRVSVGSLFRLKAELTSWHRAVLPTLKRDESEAADWMTVYAANLSEMVALARNRELALELF